MRQLFLTLTLLAGMAIITEARADEWPTGCWDFRDWGAVRLLEDRYAIVVTPQGRLLNWGVWQYRTENEVLIVWMESTTDEVLAKDGDKYYVQAIWMGDMTSKVQETKKIGK